MTGHPRRSSDTTIPRYVPAPGDTEQAAMHRDYVGFLTGVAEQCGAIGQYLRGGSPVVLVNTPELARELLIDKASELTKGSLQHTVFQALLGQSVSMSEDDRHARLRRLLAPLFTHRQMTRYADRIARTADPICAAWADATAIDLFAELHRLTVHTLGRVLITEPALWVETGQFWQAREHLWRWLNRLARERRPLVDQVAKVTDPEVTAALATVQNTVDQVIRERRRHPPGTDDLLTDIVHANDQATEPLNPTEVRDQMVALLFAAHETNAAALFWSLYLLARHPDARGRVEGEADLIRRSPEPADLNALPYTLRVVEEAMRLYPPAARQFRVAARDTALAGHMIAEGTPVSVCHYTLHRRPESFPDPGQFAPDRFASGAPARHPLSYLPFGAGTRTCLGRHYAMQEIHLLLAMLVSRFQFTFSHVVPPELAVTLRPRAGVQVQVRRR